eukprot:jgi/Botrbrau1/13452/Bobra.0082s0055.1
MSHPAPKRSLPGEGDRPSKRLRSTESDNGLLATVDPTHGLTNTVKHAAKVLKIMQCLPKWLPKPRTREPYHLPAGSPVRKTLVLDLDCTVIYSTKVSDLPPDDQTPDPGTFYMTCPDRTHFHTRTRPHVEEFLKRASVNYQIVIFTAASEAYAKLVCAYLDPEGSMIAHRLTWNECVTVTLSNGKSLHVKDLSILGRDLSSVVMVDDLPTNFVYHFNNGITVKPWKGKDGEDRELLALATFLENLAQEQDVRPVISKSSPLHRTIHTAWEQNPDSFPFRATSEEQPDVVSDGEGEDEGSIGLAAGTQGDELAALFQTPTVPGNSLEAATEGLEVLPRTFSKYSLI